MQKLRDEPRTVVHKGKHQCAKEAVMLKCKFRSATHNLSQFIGSYIDGRQ